MPRLSGGKYLEVLSARPQVDVPLGITVWDGANPATMLAELQGASEIKFQDILSDVGSGSFTIARDDPKAVTANIRDGNLVKVRLQDVDIFPFFIEAPKLVVSESGKSHWEIAGAGALSVLTQAVVYPPGWPVPTGTDRAWASATAGSILKTLLDEAKARGALAHITYDFDASVDSHAAPWPADLTLTVHAGTTVLDVAKQLAALGVVIRMTPGLVFQAFAPGTYGRDLSTSVVWRYGRHIVGDVSSTGDVRVGSGGAYTSRVSAKRAVTRVAVRGSLQNAELVEGAGGKFVEVNDPASQADPYTGRREGGLSFTSSSDPTTLQNAGNAQMAITAADSNAIEVPLNHGSAPGLYNPYADYQPGDWVSLDVPGQYEMERLQVVALTLAQTPNADYTVDADLNAVALDYLARLRNMLASKAGTASQASGGASGSLGYGAPPPTGTPIGTTPATASAPGDTAAAGVSTSASAVDHRHGREAWGLAADIGAEAFGASAAAGASGKVADAAHVHAMPANPAPSPASTVTGPDAFGASPAVGTSPLYARADHDHGLPAAPSGMTNPMTTAGDLIVGDTGGTPARLAKGADSQVLTVDPATHLLAWANSASGFADPTTTKGDLIVHGASTTRLGVGTDGQVLTADSTQTLGVKWAAAGAAAGGSGVLATLNAPQTPNADPYAIHWDAADIFDPDGYHDPASNNTRLTVPTGKGGRLFLVHVQLEAYGNSSAGAWRVNIYVNGARVLNNYIIAATGQFLGNGAGMLYLRDGDYVEALLLYSNGKNIINTDGVPYFGLAPVG